MFYSGLRRAAALARFASSSRVLASSSSSLSSSAVEASFSARPIVAFRRAMCANPMHGYDASRAGTCEYTDVHYPEPLDVTVPRKMQVADAGYFRDFGGVTRFSGPASTVKCYENNPLVREALGEPGNGRVLVVDGGGSMRCALLGDNLAGMAVSNGWAGIVINGCLRDSEDIGKMRIGVKAIAPHPVKSSKRDPGMREVPVTFAGVTVRPGDWIYADMDGMLVGGPEKFEL